MEEEEKIKPSSMGVRIGVVFFIALGILIFAAYVVVSKNVQTMLTDYTLKLVESMVTQGVTTVEYELRVSREEAEKLADSFSAADRGETKVIFPAAPAESNIRRMVYVTEEGTVASDGRQRDLRSREDIIKAFSGETTLYGPYFNEEKEFVVCYSTPVIRDEEIIGVLSIEKDGYYFSELIKNIRFIDSGESYIINAAGTDIAVSDPNHMDWVNNGYNAKKILEEQEDSVTRAIMELEQKGLNGESGMGTYYWNDGLVYVVYAPIPSVNWVLLGGMREEELANMTQSALYASVAESPVFSACIAIFLLLTAVITYWIVSSFKKSAAINQKLNIIANYDPLTGTLNRNSFHRALDCLTDCEYNCLACIYIDANGLHEINNHLGHQAGDKMLKTVVEVFRRTFAPEDVYRIGGDEFVVFCKNQDEQVIYGKTELARKDLSRQGYEVSIGIEWRNSDINTKTMVNMAEESMKLDKQRYYQENGRERQIRDLDAKVEKMVLEKQDADTFLSILAPEFMGVYFVNLGNDSTRHLFIPTYFEQMLNEAGDVFSKALSLYAERSVIAEYRQQFLDFCNYDFVEMHLKSDDMPELVYQKKDGSWLKLRILKFKTYTEQSRETLWIFLNIAEQD